MHEPNLRIDALARDFVDAATALGEAMSAQLDMDAPGVSSHISEAIAGGARVLIALEISAAVPAIRMMMIGDDQKADVIMSISGKMALQH